jgi:integrase
VRNRPGGSARRAVSPAKRDASGASAWSGREAKRLRAELGADVIRGEYRAQSRITLGEYAPTWGNTYTGRTGRGVRRETLADHCRDLDLYVIPFFGARTLLASIEPRHVKDFARSLADRGLAPNTVRVVVAPLRARLATAVEEGLIRHNPAIGLRLAGGERRAAPKAVAPEELIAHIAQMPEGMPRVLVRFLASTGLRVGEVTALVWADLDVAERDLRVERRLYRGRIDAPESRYGVRVIPVCRDMAHDLAAHRLATPFSNDEDPIFANTAGSPLDANNFSARTLKPAAERAGVPWASFPAYLRIEPRAGRGHAQAGACLDGPPLRGVHDDDLWTPSARRPPGRRYPRQVCER